MRNRLTMITFLCALLAACGSGPRMEWANERGGVVSYEHSSDAKALTEADHICGRYGRRAQVATMNSDDRRITFNCVE